MKNRNKVLFIFLFIILLVFFVGYNLLSETYSTADGEKIEFISSNFNKLNSILKNKIDTNSSYCMTKIVDANGNVPAYDYYNDINSRSIKALKAFDNKIFMGLGDWDANTGPVNILYFDTVSGDISTSGTISDEAVENFKIIDDNLYTTGRDPRDAHGYGNYYSYDIEKNKWNKYTFNDGWIHLFDMEKFGDKIFICGSVVASTKRSLIQVSNNNGQSFEDVKVVFSDGNQVSFDSDLRAYSLFTYKDELYARLYKSSSEYNGIYKYDEDNNQFVFLQSNVQINYPFYVDNDAVNSYPIFNAYLFFETIDFNEQSLYLSGKNIYKLYDLQNGQIGFEPIIIDEDYAIQAGVVNNETLYLLSYHYNDDKSFNVRIYNTNDLNTFNLVYEFNIESFPYSIEYFNNSIYIGTSLEKSIKDSSQAGTLYEIDLNKCSRYLSLEEDKKKINITADAITYSADYELTVDSSIFNVNLVFDKSMSRREWEQEFTKIENLSLLYALSNNRNVVSYDKSISYFNDVFYNNIDLSSEYSNAFEFVDAIFGDGLNIQSKRFNLSSDIISRDESEYIVSATLSVVNFDDTIVSEKYIVNEDDNYIYIGNDTDIETIKSNISYSDQFDVLIDFDNSKISLVIDNEVIREYMLISFSTDFNILKKYIYVSDLSDNEIFSGFSCVNCSVNINDNNLYVRYNGFLLGEYMLVRISSNKLKIIDAEKLYIANKTEEVVRQIINVVNAEYFVYNGKIRLAIGNDFIAEVSLLSVDFGDLNIIGNNVIIPEDILYEDFVKYIMVSDNISFKVMDDNMEVSEGNMREGMMVNIFYNNEKVDSFKVVNEFLEFDPNINVDHENRLLSNISFDKKVNHLFNKINTTGNIIIRDKNDNIIKNGGLIGTGCRVTVELSKSSYDYLVVINGDVDGNGKLSSDDINSIVNYVYNDKDGLYGIYSKAADYDENDVYNLIDIMKVANKVHRNESQTEYISSYISELYYPDDSAQVNNITYGLDTVNQLMKDIDGGIRYYGSDITYDTDGNTVLKEIDNYIYFNCDTYPDTNCETWRIIGVFNNKVKLIREKAIGGFSWNYDINSSLPTYKYNNNWEDTSIMKLLNTEYLNNKNTIYYNWVSPSGKAIEVNFNSDKFGIKDNTRSLISDNVYNLGGVGSLGIYVDEIYGLERGSSVGQPTNSTSWFGKIALPYASDYGYAVDLKLCDEYLNNYHDASCNNNWLKNIFSPNYANFFITPSSSAASAVSVVTSAGKVANSPVTTAYHIVPVVYLNSDVIMHTLGDGSKANPYRIRSS